MLPLGDDNRGRKLFPLVTYGLLFLNLIFFFLEMVGGEAFITNWAFVPSRIFSNPLRSIVTLFTAMFMHAGVAHLVGNMLYLLIFADNVESRFGHFWFLVFYLFSGVAATIAQTIFTFNSTIPILGASGAIAGVLGAYILLFPTRHVRVLLIFRVIYVPAFLVIGAWFLLQLFNSLGTFAGAAQTGGVAYLAHVGGFVAGFILTLIFR